MARSDAVLSRLMDLHPKVIDLSLDRVERILAALGHPERALPPVAINFWNGVTGLTLTTAGVVRQVYTGNGQTYVLYVMLYFLALYAASLGPAGFRIGGW